MVRRLSKRTIIVLSSVALLVLLLLVLPFVIDWNWLKKPVERMIGERCYSKALVCCCIQR